MCHSSLLLVCAVLHPYFPSFSSILEVFSNWNNSMIPWFLCPWMRWVHKPTSLNFSSQLGNSRAPGRRELWTSLVRTKVPVGRSRGKAEGAAELLLGRVELWGRLCCKVCFTPPPPSRHLGYEVVVIISYSILFMLPHLYISTWIRACCVLDMTHPWHILRNAKGSS